MQMQNQIQTIQKTSKSWKALTLLGFGSMVGSCGAIGTHAAWPLFLGGAVVFLVARLGTWWNHG